MYISQSAIALLYFYAFLLGAGLGTFYDALRITRIFLGEHYSRRAVSRLHAVKLPLIGGWHEHRTRHALRVVIFAEDFLFCIFSGIAVILLYYEAYNGRIRLPALLFLAAGFCLYRATVGKLVMLFSEVIAFCIECAARYLVFFLLFPLRWTGAKLLALLRRLIRSVLQRKRKQERKRYTEQQLREVERMIHGTDPESGKKERKRRNAKGKEEAVQPESDGQDLSGGHRRGVHRRVHQ